MSTEKSDILAGSPGWRRISEGVPTSISDPDVRLMLHAYAQVVSILVAKIDTLIDEQAKIHSRMDREVAELHGRITRRGEEHEKLRDELFNPKTGFFADLRSYVDTKFGKFTGPLFVLIGSVMSGLILLAANRLTGT